jgi:predicted nucleotidyltransferase
MLNIKPYEDKIKKICIELQIKRLDIFGSAATEGFDPNSDIDVIVEFEENANLNHFDNYFALKERLKNVFHRSIDIIIDKPIKNPYLKNTIESTRRNIYAA